MISALAGRGITLFAISAVLWLQNGQTWRCLQFLLFSDAISEEWLLWYNGDTYAVSRSDMTTPFNTHYDMEKDKAFLVSLTLTDDMSALSAFVEDADELVLWHIVFNKLLTTDFIEYFYRAARHQEIWNSLRRHVLGHENTPNWIRVEILEHNDTPLVEIYKFATNGNDAETSNLAVKVILRRSPEKGWSNWFPALADLLTNNDLLNAESLHAITQAVQVQLVLTAVASHPSAPPDLLQRLSRNSESQTRRRVAEHENTPLSALIRLSDDATSSVRNGIARNPKVPPTHLESMAQYPYLHYPLTLNPTSSQATLEHICTHWLTKPRRQETVHVLGNLLMHDNFDLHFLSTFDAETLQDRFRDNAYAIQHVIDNHDCSPSTLRLIATMSGRQIQTAQTIIAHPNTPDDLLALYALSDDEQIFSAAATALAKRRGYSS